MCLLAFCRSSLFFLQGHQGYTTPYKMTSLNNRKRDAGEGEYGPKKAHHCQRCWHNWFEIQCSISARLLELVVSGWKEEGTSRGGVGVRLQRSVMFQADFNGWAGERRCCDIHIMETQRSCTEDNKKKEGCQRLDVEGWRGITLILIWYVFANGQSRPLFLSVSFLRALSRLFLALLSSPALFGDISFHFLK